MWGAVAYVAVRTSREPGFRNFGDFVHPTLPQFTQLYK